MDKLGPLARQAFLVHSWGMARDDPYFRLRIPEALKARIEKSAAEANRSMTAEIISRLERSYDVEPEWDKAIDDVEDLLRRVEKIEDALMGHDRAIKAMMRT